MQLSAYHVYCWPASRAEAAQGGLDSLWGPCGEVCAQIMLAACVKTAAEIEAGVVSAKREQPSGEGLAEEALKQREDLLATVKAGTDAAISLKVCEKRRRKEKKREGVRWL